MKDCRKELIQTTKTGEITIMEIKFAKGKLTIMKPQLSQGKIEKNRRLFSNA